MFLENARTTLFPHVTNLSGTLKFSQRALREIMGNRSLMSPYGINGSPSGTQYGFRWIPQVLGNLYWNLQATCFQSLWNPEGILLQSLGNYEPVSEFIRIHPKNKTL